MIVHLCLQSGTAADAVWLVLYWLYTDYKSSAQKLRGFFFLDCTEGLINKLCISIMHNYYYLESHKKEIEIWKWEYQILFN